MLTANIRLLILILLAVSWRAVFAEDTALPISGIAASLTPDIVKAELGEVEASLDLDATTKATLTELYNKTLSNLGKQQANTKNAAAFDKAREMAPAEASAIRDKLQQARKKSPTVTLDVSEQTPLNKVEQRLLNEKANRAAVDAKLAELQKRLTDEADRPRTIRQRITEARQLQDQLDIDLKKGASAAEALPALTQARRWSLETRRLALRSEITMLDRELLSQPMRLDLLKARHDSMERSLQRMNLRISMLEELVARVRRTEAEKAKEEAEIAKAEMAGKHRLIRKLAARNAQLTIRLSEDSARLEKVSTGDQSANRDAKRIEEELDRARKKLEIAGLSRVLGQVLMEQRRRIPDVRNIRKEARKREGLIADVALRRIQHNEELINLRDISGYVEQLTAAIPAGEAETIRPDLEALAKKRRDLLEKFIALDDAYLRSLGELDFAQNRLIDAVQAYDGFLAERLLWVRSSTPPSLATVAEIPLQIYELMQPDQWLEVAKILFQSMTESPILLPVLMIVALLLWKKGSMLVALTSSGKKVIKPRSDRFRFTMQALVLSLLLAAPWPLLLAAVSWQLAASLEASQFARALSNVLILTASAFFYLEGFRVLCLPGGLADAHFRWPSSSLKGLRRQLGVLMVVFLPASLLGILIIENETGGGGVGLGRIVFSISVISLSFFFYQLFGPRRTTLAEFFTRHPSSGLARFRYLWLAMSLFLLFFLLILALFGFLYTAQVLFASLVDTLWLVLGLIVIDLLAVRWLLMTRRKLAFEAALERRRAALAAEQQEEKKETDGDADEGLLQAEEPEIDLIALNEESRKLVNTVVVISAVVGLWVIWSDVLPAFGFLDQVTLWHGGSVVDGKPELSPITLADLFLAMLVGILTIVATKRFPSLLEIILLKSSSITSGGRYAATSLSRYSIATIGIMLTLSIIGASWSQLQWLAAALGVGIGFGLQEIVANFISGIIILFERPIRIGDVVTVGNTDGVVTRIQIRATTIRNWERQELLVPNKEFITGRLLNWSLSDSITRISVAVGVAYGSDVNQAMGLMNEIAKENEKVLDEPPSYIVFGAFGDNTLNLELRCFVGDLDERLPTITALHQTINEKFNEAGIVIAFPQRDVHLDTTRPLDVRIHKDKDDSLRE